MNLSLLIIPYSNNYTTHIKKIRFPSESINYFLSRDLTKKTFKMRNSFLHLWFFCKNVHLVEGENTSNDLSDCHILYFVF